jgi:hypothetical protein
MFPPVDTKDTTAVLEFVTARFHGLYPEAQWKWFDRLAHNMDALFAGRDPEYAAMDVAYHDLEHTLQAVVCLSLLLEGRHWAKVQPRLDAHHFELAVTSALLHDTGYLKYRCDTEGTGAKYTFCHIIRSCSFAASYLPSYGADLYDVQVVLGAIDSTGPTTEIGRLRNREPIEKILGSALASADFAAQMAAANYPAKLPVLFEEFRESDDFIRLPAERRGYRSAEDLLERTPGFWESFVRPKLNNDFGGMYRFLARPYPDGANPYIDAIEQNIASIRRALALKSAATGGAAVLAGHP